MLLRFVFVAIFLSVFGFNPPFTASSKFDCRITPITIAWIYTN